MISTSAFRTFSPTTLTRLVYVYLSLALADGPLHDGEREMICSKVASMERFPTGEIEALVEQVQQQLMQQTELDVWTNVRLACRELCTSESDRQSLLQHLEDIMESDGRVQEKEMDMYRRISTLIA